MIEKSEGQNRWHKTHPEVRSDGPEGIACWFIDTDYNEESFFGPHAYFLGANDPYKSLKTTLKAEINEDAWASLNSDTSRPFDKPKSGRIAVKVINHFVDEVTQIREEVSFTKDRIIVCGKLVIRGKGERADDILYHKPNTPIALIEAKHQDALSA